MSLFSKPAKLIALAIFSFLLSACGSYHARIARYHQLVASSEYVKADKQLDGIKLLKKNRNQLLYFLEKGRLFHLLAKYDSSNYYLNKADLFLEDTKKTATDLALGTLMNPMMQVYQGEDFEKFMLHYYKALNYIYLNQMEGALVEARRITLQTDRQTDKFGNKSNRYSRDAFSLILQGLIYEKNQDLNNAFISYRNAADVFLKDPSQTYYGVALPEQLKLDLLRTARQNGFENQVQYYEKLFKIAYQEPKKTANGELILFWENGMAPIKEQKDFFFMLVKGAGGLLSFTDTESGLTLPFVLPEGSNLSPQSINPASLQSFRVAFPAYLSSALPFVSASVVTDTKNIPLQQIEDVNSLAILTLKQRFVKEMTLVLSRLLVKKIAEYALASNNHTAGLSALLQVYSLATEKADTRNWQTLPSAIYYARVPLQAGINDIQIQLTRASGSIVKRNIQVKSTAGLVFYNMVDMSD